MGSNKPPQRHVVGHRRKAHGAEQDAVVIGQDAQPVVGHHLALTRALLPLLDTRGRMLVAGVGVALFLFWLPAWLAQVARRRDGTASIAWLLGAGLLLAVSVSALLRAAGAGIDLTTSGGLSVAAWVLVVVAALLVPALPVRRAGQ
jgi:hypothetical protein